ncbi:MAG: acyltransferase [Acidobacteria bacterium]|nr:acyltransferase [Acidobacteriota bacterium]
MQSSSSDHYIALDHLRALAAFLVFSWHFMHGAKGFPIPIEYYPSISPFALADEGHTGVSLFMTLSGYLFAKLLEGKRIDLKLFLRNRALRLLPLLIFVLIMVGSGQVSNGLPLGEFLATIVLGVAIPTLPNGGWSITVEAHFYLILPWLLRLTRQSKLLPLAILGGALLLRIAIYLWIGEVQQVAYWTILGRIDQFVLGMMSFSFRGYFAGRHLRALAVLAAFSLFYQYFDALGGFYSKAKYSVSSACWIVLPTIEGLAYGVGIAWYDSSFSPGRTGLSGFVGRLGAYSYSIYLFHWFFVFHAAALVNGKLLPLSNFYIAFGASLVCFVATYPLGYMSYRFIESPFLQMRQRYAFPETPPKVLTAAAGR